MAQLKLRLAEERDQLNQARNPIIENPKLVRNKFAQTVELDQNFEIDALTETVKYFEAKLADCTRKQIRIEQAK